MSKVINEPVGLLYFVSSWVNIDNHNSNGHGVRGVWVRGGSHILFDPLPPVTLNVYSGPSGAMNLAYEVRF